MALHEIKPGTSQAKTGALFKVNTRYVQTLVKRGPMAGGSCDWNLPPEIALVAARHRF